MARLRNDLDIYERHADEWWQTESKTFRSLHQVNRLRLEVLQRWVPDEIRGRDLVDLGCGGGLLSEPLARMGARVIGIDISGRSLQVAREHAAEFRARPRYLCADVRRTPLASRSYQGVLLADVLEHLNDPRTAIREASRLLQPGGWLYVNTINRTLLARCLVVSCAEGLGLIPRGTHDPRLFIRPAELTAVAAEAGLRRVEFIGEAPCVLGSLIDRAVRLRVSRSTAVAYSMLFRKERA